MRIMLACAAGMSTSIVVAKMEEVAKAEGKDYKIWAVDISVIEEELGNFDVLLLGPQVLFKLRKAQKIVDGAAPVEVIDSVAYGACDGKTVLSQAEAAYERFKREGA